MEELTDQFLQGLTPAEIAEIVDQLDELNPDNALLAAGYRQSTQTEKKETGAFDREALLEYLEEHARSIPDKEDYVPYVPGQKRGKIFKKEMPKQTYSALEPDIEDALKDIDSNTKRSESTRQNSSHGMSSRMPSSA
jgi:tropomodulin